MMKVLFPCTGNSCRELVGRLPEALAEQEVLTHE